MQKAFAPRRAALRPRAEEIAAGLLDEMAAAPGDVTDLLAAYARPLPIAVLCELLGIPEADRAWIAVTVAAYDDRAQLERVEPGVGRLLRRADRRQALRARRRPSVGARFATAAPKTG